MAKTTDGITESPRPEFISGVQALVRLPLIQKARDAAAGLRTAGLISGYRGSPLGGFDQQLWRNKAELEKHDIKFQPGLNEDLAATAIWGSQMHTSFGPARVDGVFGYWYGKGPGVDRTGDVFRHANVTGTNKLGGVLAIAGDDHAAQSSTFAHQSDGIFQSVMMPVMQPSDVEEIIEYGLAGIALSRFAGVWVAMKTIAEVVESSAVVDVPVHGPVFTTPEFDVPAHGLNWDASLNWPADRMEYERRLIEERLPAVRAWVVANRINKPVLQPSRSKLCLVTIGKAHQDVMQALADLGIGSAQAEALGLGVFKYGVSWPVETETLLEAFGGCGEFLVVEEKQPIIEDQIKAEFYGRGVGRRPAVVGKTDDRGRKLLKATGELRPLDVAEAIVARLEVRVGVGREANEMLREVKAKLEGLRRRSEGGELIRLDARKPFFCAGCPHNRSTKAPDGSITGAGIGCHIMALSMPERNTTLFSHMGGEGMHWIGAHEFSKAKHTFQNLGDGTYAHSGSLAIRAAVADGANITYKILYNDAVAMTGGQPVEGGPSPLDIAGQLLSEGVARVELVSDEPKKWRKGVKRVRGLGLHHRDEMEDVQKDLRDTDGVTAIIYEQTCATEKRRRRKRNEFPDPPKRVFINERVCEGCGDCSVKSNCIAVEPKETEFGRKRKINQSSCNKDFSCVEGFCPSFIELDHPELRKPDGARIRDIETALFDGLPDVDIAKIDDAYNVFVTGIGGLGVLTLGALMGAAARFDDKYSTVLDFTGLAQKNGAVVSHVRLANRHEDLHAVRIGDGAADVLLASDALVAAAPENAMALSPERSSAVINTVESPTADNVLNRDFKIPNTVAIRQVTRRVRAGKAHKAAISDLAVGLFGDAIAANVMLLGFAWQKGMIPLSREAIISAIKLNGVAVEMNIRAFNWGRVAAHDLKAVEKAIRPEQPAKLPVTGFERNLGELVDYQDQAYADRYAALVEETRVAAERLGVLGSRYRRAVEEYAYKVMAYKDEYEVARLYSSKEYLDSLKQTFASWKDVKVWLAPPSLNPFSKGDVPKKRKFGSWVFGAFAMLRRLKGLRGTWADPFGHTDERRRERQLIEDYFELVRELNKSVDNENVHIAIELVSLPKDIRGYGHIKLESMEAARAKWARLIDRFRSGGRNVDAPSDAPRLPEMEPAE